MRHPLTKRTTPERIAAERLFPVRVRVPVPPNGLGLQLDEMHAWLSERAPDGGHFVAGDRGPPDAVLFYFADIALAHAFCAAFACGRIESTAGRTPFA